MRKDNIAPIILSEDFSVCAETHTLNVSIAKEVGLVESILLSHFFYWHQHNKGNKSCIVDGKVWFYKSITQICEVYPYLSSEKVKHAIERLVLSGLIYKKQDEENGLRKANRFALSPTVLSWYTSDRIPNVEYNTQRQVQYPTKNNNNKDNNNNKEEDTNVSPKKEEACYKEIVDCWNKSVGKKWGCVTKITDRRKDAIRRVLKTQDILQETLKRFIKTLPYADSWLSNPNTEHATWKPDFDWWMQNTNNWLTRGLEGGVHRENPVTFRTIMNGTSDDVYLPKGKRIWFNPDTQSYWSDELYIEQLYDGYSNEERPDGAILTLHNARGKIRWSKNKRVWECV